MVKTTSVAEMPAGHIINKFRHCAQKGEPEKSHEERSENAKKLWDKLKECEHELIRRAQNENETESADAWLELMEYTFYTVHRLWSGERNSDKYIPNEVRDISWQGALASYNADRSKAFKVDEYLRNADNELRMDEELENEDDVFSDVAFAAFVNLVEKYNVDNGRGIRPYLIPSIRKWNCDWCARAWASETTERSDESNGKTRETLTPLMVCRFLVVQEEKKGALCARITMEPSLVSQENAKTPLEVCRAIVSVIKPSAD